MWYYLMTGEIMYTVTDRNANIVEKISSIKLENLWKYKSTNPGTLSLQNVW